MMRPMNLQLNVGPDGNIMIPILLPGVKPGDQFDLYEDQANRAIMFKAVEPLAHDSLLDAIIQTTWTELNQRVLCTGETLNREFNLCLMDQNQIIAGKGFTLKENTRSSTWYHGVSIENPCDANVVHGGTNAKIICPIMLQYAIDRPARTRAVLALHLPEQYLANDVISIIRLTANILRNYMQAQIDKGV